MLKWESAYELGVTVIDEQHRRLFEIANRAYELLRNQLRVDKYDDIVAIVEELKEYTKYHFATEEGYMRETGYGRFLSHKTEHDDFISWIDGVDLDSADDRQEEFLMKTLDFIVDWISNHILNTDKKIVSRVSQ